MTNVIEAQLGKSLFEHRTKCGYSCDELAQAIHISSAELHAYETGRLRIPLRVLIQISDILRIPLISFFKWRSLTLAVVDEGSDAVLFDPISSEERARLRAAFDYIGSITARQHVVELAELLAEQSIDSPTRTVH